MSRVCANGWNPLEDLYLEYRDLVERLLANDFATYSHEVNASHPDAKLRRAFILALMEELGEHDRP